MTAPNPERQKAAWSELDRVFKDGSNTWVIHYSCESFYDRHEGRSPRITSIAARKLSSAQTNSFSIHQVAERRHVKFAEIEAHYDELERQMLDEFYEFVGSHRGMRYLHWNMRDVNYGFAAIDHRYAVLGGKPIVIDEDRKSDLSRILIDIYGKGYIGHPRIEKLIEKNKIRPLDFMSGKQEAEAFDSRNFVGLHQSTLRKVDILANIGGLAHDRALKTNTSWWEMHGGRLRGLYNIVIENKLVSFISSVLGIGGPIVALYWYFHA